MTGWPDFIFNLSVENLSMTTKISELPLFESELSESWQRVPAPHPLLVPGLFFSPNSEVEQGLGLSEDALLACFFATDTSDPEDFWPGASLLRTVASEATELAGRVLIHDWLIPPKRYETDGLVSNLKLFQTRQTRLVRMMSINAPQIIIQNEIREVQDAHVDMLRSVNPKQPTVDYVGRQIELMQLVQDLVPGDRQFHCDLKAGKLEWTSGLFTAKAQCLLAGTLAGDTFVSGWASPITEALKLKPNADLPDVEGCLSLEQGYALAAARADGAGFRYIYTFRSGETQVFVALNKPLLVLGE